MDRNALREAAHSHIDQLSTRQLEAVLAVLRCINGVDETESIAETASGEGLPPEDLFNKFFS